MRRKCLMGLALMTALLGCDSAFNSDEVFEESVTIGQGVAGVVSFVSNQPGESPDGVAGATVEVFDAEAFVDGQLTGDPQGIATTSDDGFFEVQLPDADWIVVDGGDRTVFQSFTVAGAVVRCDRSGSEEGQSWSCR